MRKRQQHPHRCTAFGVVRDCRECATAALLDQFAVEREERQHERAHWKCAEHPEVDGKPHMWGCPDCIVGLRRRYESLLSSWAEAVDISRELREELTRLRREAETANVRLSEIAERCRNDKTRGCYCGYHTSSMMDGGILPEAAQREDGR